VIDVINRLISFVELTSAYHPQDIVTCHINAMAKELHPVTDYHTRVWTFDESLMIPMEWKSETN